MSDEKKTMRQKRTIPENERSHWANCILNGEKLNKNGETNIL